MLFLGYLIWINYIYYVAGFWVYPVFKVLTLEQRIGFFTVCAILGGCLFFIGDFLNKVLWGSSNKQKKNK